MKTAILYTANNIDVRIWDTVIELITYAARFAGDVRLICMTTDRIYIRSSLWETVVWPMQERGYTDCYQKIRAALDITTDDTVYLLEHDVFYPPTYFLGDQPPDSEHFYYNDNGFTLNHAGWFDHWRPLTSNLVAHRTLLIEDFDLRLKWRKLGKPITWDEPGGMGEVAPMANWHCEQPVIDIRHKTNLTGYRRADVYVDSIPFWEGSKRWVDLMGLEDPG